MIHAIEVLKIEAMIISKALKKSDWEKHPEARKRQQKKLKEIGEAIKTLENAKRGETVQPSVLQR